MPCVRKSSVLTAATAALSSIYSSSVPAATTVAQSSLSSTSVGQANATPTLAVSSTSAALATGSPTSASSTSAALATGSPTSAASSAAASATGTTTSSSGGNTTYAGVNIAGFDFGCDTNGQCTVDGITNIATGTGPAQMQHFATNDNLNMFRLSVGWQYLTNSVVGGDLDATNFANYDDLMTSCLATGAKCIVDIHNYARWDGEIIGQGGPTNDEFAALWTSLATQYANNTNVIFGVMNEPHDLTVSTWAQTVQAAVTAIRAVAPDHMVLMPGSSYSSAATLPTEAGPDLLNVTNPDGSTTNLLFDVHKYLDSDNSGTSTECVTNNIDDAFSPLATWLRENNRQAILSETGGGNTASCLQYVCEELAYLNNNTDVYLGYVGWAAGGFDSTYALTLTPTGTDATSMVDTELMTSCFAR